MFRTIWGKLIKKPQSISINFVKFDIAMNKVPREFRDVFMKFIHNVYMTRIESSVSEINNDEKIKILNKAEELLRLYNSLKNLNAMEEQKVKIQETKEKIKEKKESSFLFG